MKRLQHGFTLIELMIVVAIVGLLASIALPAYQDYTIRAKITEVILAISACRSSISEVYQTGGTAPAANSWGCEGIARTRYVQTLSTDANGAVTATLVTGINANVDGKLLTLIPLVIGVPADSATDMGKAVNGWTCGGAGTTLSNKYLPGSCRG